MTRASLPACAAALLLLAGCGAQKPVTRDIPGDFLGYKLADLPHGYGIKCPAAMQVRHKGAGDGASTMFNAAGVQLVSGALRFSDAGAAQWAYAATISPQARRCYADGFAAELVRRYHVKVRRVQTGPAKVGSAAGDERSASRVSVVIAAGRGDLTVFADSSAIRSGSALSINQVIDLTALGRAAGAPDLGLAQALF
jgi:hypothetical protein